MASGGFFVVIPLELAASKTLARLRLPAFVLLRTRTNGVLRYTQTDVTAALPRNDGLRRLQAAGSRRPSDTHLHKPNENRRQPKPDEDANRKAGTDAHKDREPAAGAALTFTRKDAGRGAAQLPDGRKRLGRDAAHAQTRHAPVIGFRRLFRRL